MNNTSIKSSNAGFSLVELIVAMLITSVVSISVIAFVSLAFNEYSATNSEVGIQMESSSAEDFLTKSIREATDYKYFGTSSFNTTELDGSIKVENFDNPILIVRGAEIEKGVFKYTMFVGYSEENVLLYTTDITGDSTRYYMANGSVDEGKVSMKAKNMTSTYKKYLLADHVESFSISEIAKNPSLMPTEYKTDDDNKVLKATISYKYGRKSFNHDFEIKVRNNL